MARVPIPLGLGRNDAISPAQSVERLINAYLEVTPNGREPAPVYGIPGFTLFSTTPDNVRGMLEVAGELYVVAGDNLHRIDSSGVVFTLYSSIIPETGGVMMASDGTNIVIANTTGLYVWNIPGSSMTDVTDPDAPVTSSVDYVDGYFVFGIDGTGEWQISDLQDPTSFDPLNFATAEWKPDKLLRPLVRGRTLLLMGVSSIEGQINAGDADFPFIRTQDLFVDVGIAGRDAACVANEAVYFLASDLTARRLDGATATRISTHAEERAFADWSEPQNTIVTAHTWRGHPFVVFRNGEGCLVYDESTKRWHERKRVNGDTWAVLYHATCYGLQLFSRDNEIYYLDASTTLDFDVPYELLIQTPTFAQGGKRFSVHELELIMQTGMSPSGQGTVYVSYTRDGETWSAERSKVFSAPASKTARIRLGRYGQGRAIAWRIRITGTAARAVLGLYADVAVER